MEWYKSINCVTTYRKLDLAFLRTMPSFSASQTYLRCNGVKSLSYSADAESPIAGGDSIEALEVRSSGQPLALTTCIPVRWRHLTFAPCPAFALAFAPNPAHTATWLDE